MQQATDNQACTGRQNLLGLGREALQAYFVALGEKPYRGDQVFKWIHQQGADSFDQMSNISKGIRTWLNEHAEIRAPEIDQLQASADGTRKWLLRLPDGNGIETVFIPEEDRGTLCVSSQVGCALNCSFCATALQGYNRNLTSDEIIGQVWQVARYLKQEDSGKRHITNIVFMGMGEPLLNLENVIEAIHILLDDLGYGLSKRRVTVSTSGVVPQITRLREACDVSLAISLHAPDNDLRNQLVPINKKYPLEQLIPVCRDYLGGENRRRITMEYVMIDGVNDSEQHARKLIKLLRQVPSKVNLIPFNPHPGAIYKRSSDETINRFRDLLDAAGLVTVTRKTRGDDIDAACGQLAGEVQDRTQRSVKMLARAVSGG